MAEIINGVPIGDLPGIESVPDDSMLVVEFLGKAYHMPGAVLRQMIQDVLDSMGDSVDDVTEARLTAAIETVLSSGKYNGVSPSVEVLDEEDGTTVIHIIDAFGDKRYPVEVKGATDAVRYKPQTLTDAQKKQARENIDVSPGTITVKLSGSVTGGFDVVLNGESVTNEPLDRLAEEGYRVVGVATSEVKVLNYKVPAGTLFEYTNVFEFEDNSVVGSPGARRFVFRVQVDDCNFTLRCTDGVWGGILQPIQATFFLKRNNGVPFIQYNGKTILPEDANWLSVQLILCEVQHRPVFCFQGDMQFFTDNNTAIQPPWGTAFSLRINDDNDYYFATEYDGYELQLLISPDGFVNSARKTSVYKAVESKADDLKAEDGTLFLLSAGEPIGAGVPLPTGNADDSKIFIADLNTSTYEDIKAADDAGKICYALWGGYTACMLTTLSPESAIFTTLLDPHLGLYVKFTKGTVGVSDFGLTESHSILYEPQSLTDAQKAQARENIGALSADDIDVDSIGSNVFVGNYDTVTFTEIKTAHDAGRVCFLNFDGLMIPLLNLIDTDALFVREINSTTDFKVTITSDSGKDFTLVDKNTPIYVAQTLTDDQKAQARTNIGAMSTGDVNTVLQQAKDSGQFDGPAGPAGPAGPTGATGKTAYAYAQDGGYTGTEEEFATKLASESDSVFVADYDTTTFAEIKAAHDAGKVCFLNLDGLMLPLLYLSDTEAFFIREINDTTDYKVTVTSAGGKDVTLVDKNTPIYVSQSLSDAQKAQARTNIGALGTGGGTITGALSINDKLTQGSPSGDSSVASMNRFQADLFVQGNGTAPNTPTVAGFYLGKSASDENRHMDIVSGGEYSYIDFNKAGRGTDFDARLLVNVASGWTDFTWGSHGDITQRVFNVNGSIRQNGTEVLTWGNAGTDSILPARLRSFQEESVKIGDPDYATETGFYYIYGLNNRPPFSQSTNIDYRVLTTAHSSNWLQQIATDFRCGDMFLRRRENGTWTPWVRFATAGDLSGYLPLGGGLMTGSLKFQDSSLPQKSLEFICGIDAFANGGEMGWQSKAEFLSGYALKSDIPTNYAKLKTYNDFVHDGNEITMVPAGYNQGGLYFNYRTASGQYDGNINNYVFCNGKGSTAGVTLTADSFSGTAARATADGNGNNIASTYLPKAGGTMTGEIAIGQQDGNGIQLGRNGRLNATTSSGSTSATVCGMVDDLFLCGNSAFMLSLRGSSSRPTYNGNSIALTSDVVEAANGSLKVTLSGNSTDDYTVDKTLAQIETALNAGRHVYMVENDGQVYQLSMHMAGVMACFTSVVTSGTQVTVITVIVYDGMSPSVIKKTL